MKKYITIAGCIFSVITPLQAAPGDPTNAIAALSPPTLPEVGPSILRIFGSLAIVIGIFLGGVWLYRNWQRLTLRRGRVPRLNILETRPLGGRQAIHVIGYESDRFLIASSAAGIQLLSHLPPAEAEETASATAAPSFAQALNRMLGRK
jgi:flagellar biogenesis protein FliO